MNISFLDWKRFRLVLLFCLLVSTINIFEVGFLQTSISLPEVLSRWIIGFFYLSFSFVLIQAILKVCQSFPSRFSLGPWILFPIANVITCIIFLWLNDILPIKPIHQLEIIIGTRKLNITVIRIFLGETFLYVIYNLLASIEEKKSFQLQNEQLKSENLKVQFEVLKQQTNPHFLFNALNTLRIMVRENDPHSEDFIIKLSSIYRDLLNKKDLPYISLQEELEFTNAYIFLLKSRFQENLQVIYSLIPEVKTLFIPTFSLQILIENCIKHNIISNNRPLTIYIEQKNEREVTVKNNLQIKPSKPENSGIGLSNLINRYALLNIEKGLDIESSEDYFMVRLKLFEK